MKRLNEDYDLEVELEDGSSFISGLTSLKACEKEIKIRALEKI